MPELPEVQTVVNYIRPILIGEKVKSITPLWPKVFHNFSDRDLQKKINGEKIIEVLRRGKFIVIQFKKVIMAIHLRMTGKVYYLNKNNSISKHTTALFTFESKNQLVFDDVRKFGRLYLYNSLEPLNKCLGPEPLSNDFSLDLFSGLLKGRKRNTKALLLDQSVLAGLGNIYVDESLWKSGIHPNSISNVIPAFRVKKLYKNIKNILTDAINKNGTTIIDFSVNGESGKYTNDLQIYNRNKLDCFHCKNKITKIRVAGRGTHICLKCQKIYNRKNKNVEPT